MEKYDRAFMDTIEKRFKDNMDRHPNIKWDFVKSSILNNPDLYDAIFAMEETGGEPDLVDLEIFKGLVYVDLADKSPVGRRSLCYDKKARQERKENAPVSSVEEEIGDFGIKLLSEEKYIALAEIATFDTKTTSWIKTPDDIRVKGGALFAGRRFDRIFVYYNSPGSYYKDRGFRAYIEI
ncbi:DUF4256 domain-containing protein [uncultured Anaerococcus sp.]|uniref:DUF4256 domain-containing protein n=1 Tax=uncultured Anaerococcus sp. TaxID=293428 RepID=UPI00288AB245|nr:DUF4256 domain-containing protein [uncultured Anaerococcus sp.]